MVHLVEFIDEQHTGFVSVTQSTQERTLGKEIQRLQSAADGVPVFSKPIPLDLKEQFLER